jgi:hypothetical protein
VIADNLDLLMFVTMCVVILAGFPVLFTLAGIGVLFAGIGYMLGVFDPQLARAVAGRIFGIMTNQILLAIPLFVVMGVALERSRIAEELLDCLVWLFGRLPGGLAISVSAVGALLAASDLIWRERLGRLLSREEVQELLGLQSRQAVHDLAKRGRLLALATQSGRSMFPAFQFDLEHGRTYSAVPPAIRHFKEAHVDPYTAASWFCEPQPLLEGLTPAEWLRERRAERPLIEAARRSAAPLAR